MESRPADKKLRWQEWHSPEALPLPNIPKGLFFWSQKVHSNLPEIGCSRSRAIRHHCYTVGSVTKKACKNTYAKSPYFHLTTIIRGRVFCLSSFCRKAIYPSIHTYIHIHPLAGRIRKKTRAGNQVASTKTQQTFINPNEPGGGGGGSHTSWLKTLIVNPVP